MCSSRSPSAYLAAGRLSTAPLDGLQGFAMDVKILCVLWRKNFTVMVSGFTFTACYKSREVEISKPYVKRDGTLGSNPLGVLAWIKSGEIRVQWFNTALSTVSRTNCGSGAF